VIQETKSTRVLPQKDTRRLGASPRPGNPWGKGAMAEFPPSIFPKRMTPSSHPFRDVRQVVEKRTRLLNGRTESSVFSSIAAKKIPSSPVTFSCKKATLFLRRTAFVQVRALCKRSSPLRSPRNDEFRACPTHAAGFSPVICALLWLLDQKGGIAHAGAPSPLSKKERSSSHLGQREARTVASDHPPALFLS
jgi:hypothetical protein